MGRKLKPVVMGRMTPKTEPDEEDEEKPEGSGA